MSDSLDKMALIVIVILVILVWAGIVVVIKLPRIEMLTRGMYEELKRIYDALENGDRSQTNRSLICKSCGKPIEAAASFCGECGRPVTLAVSA